MKPDLKNTRKRKVMIAATNVLFRRGLRALLAGESDIQVMEALAGHHEILERVGPEQVHVLIFACEHVKSDVPFLDRLRPVYPTLRMIAVVPDDELTATSDRSVLCVRKSSSPAELLHCIRSAVAENGPATSSSSDLRALSEASREGQRPDALTLREKEVVRLLAEGLTVREAALELGLSAKTVEAHTLNLMRKLAVHDRASVIEYAFSSGIAESPVTA